MKVIDQIANLLATENLTVVRAQTKTASFNTKTRVLVLPNWAKMHKQEEETLVAHEVGHALFTTGDEWVKAIENVQAQVGQSEEPLTDDAKKMAKAFEKMKTAQAQRIFKSYINVVEDARIEKLMKRRYPGLRKTFFAGYKSLVERDFFKINGIDIETLSLIDRINLFFKIGSLTKVSFSREEMVFVNRIENQETIDDMILIAQDLYEYSKNQAKDQQSQTENDHDFFGDEESSEMTESEDFEDSDDDSYGDYGEYDEDGEHEESDDEGDPDEESDDDSDADYNDSDDESDEGSESKGNSAGENSDDEEFAPESITDKNLNDSLAESADDSIRYEYYELAINKAYNPIVDYKTVLAETKVLDEVDVNNFTHFSEFKLYRIDQVQKIKEHYENFQKFMSSTERAVSYLVKEFEMKKAAESYRRSSTSKTGSVNTKKLYQYKLTDDIFKRITVVKDGKNHGMVFLLDWSGSMQKVIKPTIEQIINLTLFCRRVNIPFEVFAFSDAYDLANEEAIQINGWSQKEYSENKNLILASRPFKLLNIFSSKMTNNEFIAMARRFTCEYVRSVRKYDMGGTPLNESLAFMVDYIPEFKRRNSIEKLSFITLTDGAGCTMYSCHNAEQYRSKAKSIKRYFNDPVTGKSYMFSTNDSFTQTTMLLNMIRDRYDVSSIGFYITSNNRRDVRDALFYSTGVVPSLYYFDKVLKDFKTKGFHSVLGCGRDELFIIPDTSTKISEQVDIGEVASLSASSIARKLTKMMTSQRTSRILLDKFVDLVA